MKCSALRFGLGEAIGRHRPVCRDGGQRSPVFCAVRLSVGPPYGKPVRSRIWKCGTVHEHAAVAISGIGVGADRLRVDSAFDAAVQSVKHGADRRLAVVSGRECGSNHQVLTAAVAGTHDDRDNHPPRTNVGDGN